VAALEARQVEHGDVGVAGRELGGPHLLHRVDRVVLGPDVGHVARVLDVAEPQVLGEDRIEVAAVLGDRAHRQDRVAERLELLEHGVVEARVVVVRAADHQQRDAVLGARPGLEDLAALGLHVPVELVERGERLIDGVVVLVLGDAEQRAPLAEQLLLAHQRLVEVTAVSR
jgi:hypothetical protein